MLKDFKNIILPNNVSVETVFGDSYYNPKIVYFLAKHDHSHCSKLLRDDYIDKMANMQLDYKMTEDNVIEVLYYFDEYYDMLNVWDENI